MAIVSGMGEAVQTLWEMAYGRCSQAVEGSGVGVGMKTDGGRVKRGHGSGNMVALGWLFGLGRRAPGL